MPKTESLSKKLLSYCLPKGIILLPIFIVTNLHNLLTSGKMGTLREVSLETEPYSSIMVVHDVRDKLKTYYYIMSSEKTSENIFEKAGKGGSFTYPQLYS